MKLGTTNYRIRKNKNEESLLTNLFGKDEIISTDDSRYKSVYNLYRVFRKRTLSTIQKDHYMQKKFEELGISVPVKETVEQNETRPTEEKKDISKEVEAAIQKMIDFMSEFDFEPNFRFLNTFAYACQTNSAKKYIRNYFELTDSPYTQAIDDKMTSQEFRLLCDDFKEFNVEKKINTRFKLYYGSAGTGKTTIAMKEAKECVVCNSAMLPNDLMEDFKFVDGKPEFIPSALQLAMRNGTEIVLDEINLLPFESLRFLQTILDGKSEFMYKGKKIEIKDGFKVIGTMNLAVNGNIYSLPEPLVDRCEEIRKFKLSAKDLVGAIC